MPRPLDDTARRAGLAWTRFYQGLQQARHERETRSLVVRAKHYIDKQFVDGPALDRIAVEAQMSKYHFVRAFAEIFRRTPHRYLVERRIKRARELLERTDMSVTAVCFEVGFESLGTFVARFRQMVGEPPGRYRQRFAHDGAPHLRAVPACLHRALAMRPPRTTPSAKDSNSGEADSRARK